MSRLDALAQPFDVAVIGGGIVGAGIARDAARRGLRVALLEKRDFGGGTTSASTRLVHGGLRYLETADFTLVRLDLRERERLLRIAPHLVKPLAFLLPFFSGHAFERLRLRAGMWLYDALSFDKSLPSHHVLDRPGVAAFEPALAPELVDGGAVYYDAQVHSPERLTIENVVDAAEHGAVALNYVDVTGALHDDGRVVGVTAHDSFGGGVADVRARVVVNASGPWLDAVAARVEAPRAPRVRMTKGIHVACEPFTTHAVALPSAVDGRLVFTIPWAGYTWLGTTDSDFAGDPATVRASADEVEYLVASVEKALPAARRARRFWTTAGVRALATAPGSASRVSRMHRIVTDAPGLISVIGGKITGYRGIAEEATDLVATQLGCRTSSSTADVPLPGGGQERSGVAHLDAIYGSRASRISALASGDTSLGAALAPGSADIAAQVVFSVRHEWCLRLEDFMLRRSYLGFRPDRGIDAADAASRLMQRELGWTEAQRLDELNAYRRRIREDSEHVA